MEETEKKELARLMAENLHTLRSCLGLTQQQLSELVGISRHTVISVEGGKRELSWCMFLALVLLFSKDATTMKLLGVLGIYTEALTEHLTNN